LAVVAATNGASAAGTAGSTPDFVANTVLLGFRAGTPAETAHAIEASVGARDIGVIGAGTHLLHVRSGGVLNAVAALRASPAVRYAEPDWILAADQVPSDPGFGNEWGLYNQGQTIDVNDNTSFSGTPGADVKAPPAWDLETGQTAGPAPVVGIDDTGVYYSHADLAPNMWAASASPFPFSYIDSNGVTQTASCAAGTHGWDAIREVCDPFDPAFPGGHGTRVAGVIGARGNDGVGVAGVNWTTHLMGLRWDQNSCLCGATSDAIEAIDYAIQAKHAWDTSAGASGANVRVLSNSWGCCYPTTTPTGELPYSAALLDEVRKAASADILFVASAGNKNHDIDPPNYQNGHYPCSFDDAQTFGTYNTDGSFTPDTYEQSLGPATNVICVASSDYFDNKSSFSNWGKDIVQIAAPGSYIYSDGADGGYGFSSGTSLATPFVSGAAALILAQHPTWTTGQVKQRLVGTYSGESGVSGCECGYQGGGSLDQLGSLQGLLSTGGGRLNLCKAIDGCVPGTPGTPSATETTTGKKRAVTVSWAAPPNGGTPTGYRIYRATGASAFTLLATVGTTTTYRDGSVTVGSTYSYRISAINYGGEGAPSSPSAPLTVK
jgi:subtilisin family serine protease